MKTFENQWIWITGASAGLGAAMARAFDQENANLILSARNEEKLQEVVQSCSGKGEKHILPLDLTKIDSFSQKVNEAISFGQRIDILINNGGISQRALALETPGEVSRRVFEVNFFGTIELTRLVLPIMLQQKSGHIMTISSVVGKFGSPYRSSYSASKHALQGYFDSLRFEVEQQGIDITMICPGFIRTDVTRNALTAEGKPQNTMDKKTDQGMAPDKFAEKVLKNMKKKKKEAYIGGIEILAVYMKRYVPWLFRRVIARSEVR